MLFRQYPQVLLTSFLIVELTKRASIAFNIIPPHPNTTKFYRPESTYPIDNNREGRTEIDMRLWSQPLPYGGTSTLKRVLSLWSLQNDCERVLGYYKYTFVEYPGESSGSWEKFFWLIVFGGAVWFWFFR